MPETHRALDDEDARAIAEKWEGVGGPTVELVRRQTDVAGHRPALAGARPRGAHLDP